MAQDLDRVYTIPLGKVLLSPDNHRAKRAINMIRAFARRHMKIDDVRIDQDVAETVWARGMRRPPRRIRVYMTRAEDGYIQVSMYGGPEGPVVDATPVAGAAAGGIGGGSASAASPAAGAATATAAAAAVPAAAAQAGVAELPAPDGGGGSGAGVDYAPAPDPEKSGVDTAQVAEVRDAAVEVSGAADNAGAENRGDALLDEDAAAADDDNDVTAAEPVGDQEAPDGAQAGHSDADDDAGGKADAPPAAEPHAAGGQDAAADAADADADADDGAADSADGAAAGKD